MNLLAPCQSGPDRRHLFSGSLRRQLVAAFALAVLALFLVSVSGIHVLINRTERDGWKGRQKEATQRVAGTVGDFIERQQDLLQILDLFDGDDLHAESAEFQHLLQDHPALLEVVYIDAAGRVIVHAPAERGVLANLFTIPQSRWFSAARHGERYVGDVQLSAGDEPYLILAAPAANGNVVAIRLRLDVLNEVIARLHFGDSGTAYLVNQNGRFIAYPDRQVVLAQAYLDERFLRLARESRGPWAGEYINFQGVPVVGTMMPIAAAPWVAVTELPQDEAYAASRRALWIMGAGTLLSGLLLSGALSLFLKRRFLSPMQRLQEGVRRIDGGDLTYRITMAGSGEISHVARAFDQMAARLQAREQQVAAQTAALQENEARYRAIVEDQTELICRFLPDGTLTFVNEAFCRYFGRPREALIGATLLPSIPEEDQTGARAQMAAMRRDNPVAVVEHRVVLPDGTLRWQKWTYRLIFNAQGRPLETAGVGRDITDRRRAEEALLEAKATLEQRVQERTGELAEQVAARQRALNELAAAQSSLLEASRVAGMAEVATGVLHNVGNVLNSVNVSCTLLLDQLGRSRVGNVAKVAEMLDQARGDLARFVTEDPRGRQIPDYLASLAEALGQEHRILAREAEALRGRIDHIKEIVSMQQSYGRVLGVSETIGPEQLMEDALKLHAESLARHGVTVERHYAPIGPITVDKHAVLQILLNLIHNAKYACADNAGKDKTITLRIEKEGADQVRFQVGDNGVGITAANMTRIFQHGFTTRKSGHGYGLHSGALAARQLGGQLSAHSDGPGTGATFTLELPCRPGENK